MRFIRKRLAIVLIGSVVVLGAGGGALAWYAWPERPGLTGVVRPEEGRNRRLLALAAAEAGAIADVDARLTRQLNLADQQIRRGWGKDARATLAGAGDTLTSRDAERLTAHALLSGWVSISELSRQADDARAGRVACDHAVKALKDLPDPARRCQYVMGIANELQYLQGQDAAAALLTEAGTWAKEIGEQPERRRALVAFASALFNLDQFEAGQVVLRNDEDPVWRSDLLAQMSVSTFPQVGGQVGDQIERHRGPVSGAREFDEGYDVQSSYGRPMNYEQIFRNQRNSQTAPD